MTDISRVPFSNVATQQYEPFIYAGQSFGEVHWLPTTSGGKGQLTPACGSMAARRSSLGIGTK